MDKLTILWVNDNPLTARTMVFMYAINSKVRGWWSEVDVVIWGATAKLVAEDQDIQALIKEAQDKGVHFLACVSCTSQLGVTGTLSELGIDVQPMGAPLTEILKSESTLLTI